MEEEMSIVEFTDVFFLQPDQVTNPDIEVSHYSWDALHNDIANIVPSELII